MTKERRQFSAEEKVAILRKHLVEKGPISDVCDECGIQPTQFYQWQKTLFEGGCRLSPLGKKRRVAQRFKKCESSLYNRPIKIAQVPIQ